MARHRSGTIEIDLSEYVDQIEDDVLIDELKSRGLSTAGAGEATDLDIVKEAYAELLRGRHAEALGILDRLLNAKWKSVDECAEDLAERRHLFGRQ